MVYGRETLYRHICSCAVWNPEHLASAKSHSSPTLRSLLLGLLGSGSEQTLQICAATTSAIAGNCCDRSLLPLYRAITTVQIEDGSTTLFWTDVWNGDDALADRLPRLYSHCTRKEDTVQQAIASNLHGAFVNRLSPHAQQELQLLIEIVQQTTLSAHPDRRLSPFSRSPDKLDTSTIYKLLKAKGQPDDPASTFIWKNAAPPRVQLFIWFLTKGRMPGLNI